MVSVDVPRNASEWRFFKFRDRQDSVDGGRRSPPHRYDLLFRREVPTELVAARVPGVLLEALEKRRDRGVAESAERLVVRSIEEVGGAIEPGTSLHLVQILDQFGDAQCFQVPRGASESSLGLAPLHLTDQDFSVVE